MLNRITSNGDRGMTRTLRTLLIGSAFALAASACADPEEINRVQPNLIEKSQLASGEYFVLDTVVQAPFASHSMFPGLQGLMERGVFEIERDFLYFYRTYEFVHGVEQQGLRSDADTPVLDEDGNAVTYEKTLDDGRTVTATKYVYRSAPLARWTIEGHFDVRQQYNSLTGEASNVTVEDSGEKFWWQRSHMRVDFGSDTAGNRARFTDNTYYNALVYEGETGPEELRLRIDDGGDYIDYVVRAWADAPRSYLRGWGWIPTCLYYPWYTGSYYECGEEEFHIRTAFLKVQDNKGYPAWDYNDHMQNKFGFFRSERANHDEFYGQTFTDAKRHIGRFRVFEQYVDGDGDGMMDYASMTPKPLVYYMSEEFPRELVPGALDLADQWNSVFTELIETLTGKAYAGRMFVLCENSTAEVASVIAADANAPHGEVDETYCQKMDQPKRFGDIRFNLLASINEPVQYGLYGYGPMNLDPFTGETIQANAFNYSKNMRLGARNTVDYIEYVAGVQNFRDITQAEHIKQDVKAKALAGNQNTPSVPASLVEAQQLAATTVQPSVHGAMMQVGLEATDLDTARAGLSRLLKDHTFDWMWMNHDMAAAVGFPVDALGALTEQEDTEGVLRNLVHPANMASEDTMLWQHKHDADLGRNAICMGDKFDDTFRAVAYQYKAIYDKALCDGLGARIEGGEDLAFDLDAFKEPGMRCDTDASVCGEMQVCTQLDQGEVSGKFCMTRCSAAMLLDQLRLEIRRVNQWSDFAYWDPNALYTDVKDSRVLASQLAAKEILEPLRERVFLEVQDRIWSTVAMHEVGHNVGLRHNFASSTDALNYHPGFWGIKGVEDASGTWHAKSIWGETPDQVAGSIREYQQTTVMEYGSGFNARYQGLGSYDRAAILFGYGQLVEVFENPPAYSAWSKWLAEPSDADPVAYAAQSRYENPLAFALRKVHHTNLPAVFGGLDNLLDRKFVPASTLATTVACSRFDAPYDPTVCAAAGEGSFCEAFPHGHFCSNPAVVEVPYRFCSDEYNSSSPTCQTRDEGADVFQMVKNHLDDFEAYWPFRAYKRDSDFFNPGTGYFNSVFSSMLFRRKHFEHWSYDYIRYNSNDWWEKQYGLPWHLDINGGLSQTLAAQSLFESMANVFGRPSDGYYGWNLGKRRYEPVVNNGKNQYTNIFQVREDTGARPMYPSYDFSGYLYTPARAGTYYDRLAALQVMLYPRMIYVRGVDENFDTRRFTMSFATMWPQRMQNLLSGLISGEEALFGWCIEHDGAAPDPVTGTVDGDPLSVKRRLWFGTDADLDAWYDNCTALTPEPEYSFPTTQYRWPGMATIYGLGWRNPWDRTFSDRLRIGLDGEGNDVTLAPGFEKVSYTDPFSGKTYVAPYDPEKFDPTVPFNPRDAVPDQDGTRNHDYWISARMLHWANKYLEPYLSNLSQLSDEYHYSDLQQLVGRLEIIRGLYHVFEY